MKIKENYHPRLFGFSGFSGVGKTTLIEKLIKSLSSKYKIGFIKHDSHQFSIDHEGKDTKKQWDAGANTVFINDPNHFSFQVKGETYGLEKEFFKDCELLFVEGHKYSNHRKFLFLDEENRAYEEYVSGKINSVIATISIGKAKTIEGVKNFSRDNVEEILNFIETIVADTNANIDLKALILVGGKSSRMGIDKYTIKYHGQSQLDYLMSEFKKLEIPSYISCRENQLNNSSYNANQLLQDRFVGFGPLGGILTAMKEFPSSAILVVACDLPFLDKNSITELIKFRNPLKQATAYFNLDRKQYEPLFAIYEPTIFSRMMHFMAEGLTCPQKVLFNSNVEVIKKENLSFIENVNTPEEMVSAKEKLGVHL